MAGIFGICGKGIKGTNELEEMANLLSHRGRKSYYYSSKEIALGMCTSEVDSQISANKKDSVISLFDGILYNRHTIKECLESKGYLVSSTSPAELIGFAYEMVGEKFVHFLDGAFVFAIWDAKKKRLLLGRDQFGLKPLYYSILKEKFIFASECKALLNYLSTKEIDLQALYYYFTHRYCVSGERTLFNGIKKVLPSTILIWKEPSLYRRIYWTPPTKDLEISKRAVHSRLLNFYKKYVYENYTKGITGICLSGGIDSSSLTAIASEVADEKVKTFSIGYENKEFSELQYVKSVADFLRTKHYEKVIKSDLIKKMPRFIWYADDLSGCALNTITKHALLNFAKDKGCHILLDGYGSEEVFGQTHSEIMYWNRRIAFFFPFLKPQTFSLQAWLSSSPLSKLRKILSYHKDPIRLYLTLFRHFFLPQDLKDIYSPLVTRSINLDDTRALKEGAFNLSRLNTYNQGLYLNLTSLLPNCLIARTERAASAKDMEFRHPLLRRNLIEFTFQIPVRYKLIFNKPSVFYNFLKTGWRFHEKGLLREIMKGKLPETIRNREAYNSAPPIEIWINEQREIIQEVLRDFSRRPYIKSSYLNNLLKRSWSKLDCFRLSIFFNLELWHRIFLDQGEVKQSNINVL